MHAGVWECEQVRLPCDECSLADRAGLGVMNYVRVRDIDSLFMKEVLRSPRLFQQGDGFNSIMISCACISCIDRALSSSSDTPSSRADARHRNQH